MKSMTFGALLLFCCLSFMPDGNAQSRKTQQQTPVRQNDPPNVSGQPAYLTAPDVEKATPSQPDPIKVPIKRQRRVRIVPAPPPGPPAPAIPPKEMPSKR